MTPRPQRPPLIRRMRLAIRRTPEALLAAAREQGHIIQLGIGPKRLVILSEPAAVEQVLRVQHGRFTKGKAHTRARGWLGQGILVSEGDEHHRQRRLLVRALAPQRVAAHSDAMVRRAEQLAERWQDGETRDIWQDMLHLAVANIAAAIWGEDVDVDIPMLSDALEQLATWLNQGGSPLVALRDRLPLPEHRATQRVRAWLDALIDTLTERHRHSQADTILSSLLQSGDPLVTPSFIHDQLLTLLLGGRETSGTALTWTWHLIASHTEIQAQIHAELDRALAGRTPTMADIEHMPYLENVIREVLRMYPPAWSTVRRAHESCRIGETHIPAGAVVVMSQYVLHRDPRWFAQPDQFQPERWDGDGPACPKGAYIPFGMGPRRCIGEGFAWAEIMLTIAAIAQRWHLEALPDQRITLRPSTSLQPAHGITLRVARRSQRTV
ncbi:cytochrome P450 [Chloroflexia bacterium SDU3-3]|nr:cytochrome P450 [Chloroflexia bacterium SDU3-3]